jgi:hypothetical protein
MVLIEHGYHSHLDDIQLLSAMLVIVFLSLPRADYCIFFAKLQSTLSAKAVLSQSNNIANAGQAIRADNNFRNHDEC